MDEQLKKRLIGAAVLVSLAVIFIPMLLEDETVLDTSIYKSNIPERDKVEFQSPLLSEEEIQQKQSQDLFGSSIQPDAHTEVTEVTDSSTVEPADETAATQTRVGLSSWMIQVGSFSSRENAEKLLQELRKQGFDSHLEQAQVNQATVFRVRVGPEVERSNAEKLAKQIAEKFKLNGKVIRYP
ncbi:MAG: SPOR domain-containing protein [Chromatiales bacterium]|jgi:DedD protein